MKFISLDPALRNFGITIGHFDGQNLIFQEAHLIQTKPKKAPLKALDDVRCIREILQQLKPLVEGVDIIFSEIPTGSQNGRAAVSLSTSLAIVTSLDKPTIFVTPTQVKAITGNKKATKTQMVNWAYKKHPQLDWIMNRNKLVNASQHIADSVAVAYACADLYRKKGKKVIT